MCSCPCLLYCVPDLWKGQMMSCNLQTAGNNSYSVGRDSAMCSILLSRWTIQNQEGTASGSLLKRRCTTKSAARTAPLLCSLSPTIPRNPFCESIFNRQHPINWFKGLWSTTCSESKCVVHCFATGLPPQPARDPELKQLKRGSLEELMKCTGNSPESHWMMPWRLIYWPCAEYCGIMTSNQQLCGHTSCIN